MCPWGGSGLFSRGQGSTIGCTWGRTRSPTTAQAAQPTAESYEGSGKEEKGKESFQEPSPGPGLWFAQQSSSTSDFSCVQLLINPLRANKSQSHSTLRMAASSRLSSRTMRSNYAYLELGWDPARLQAGASNHS